MFYQWVSEFVGQIETERLLVCCQKDLRRFPTLGSRIGGLLIRPFFYMLIQGEKTRRLRLRYRPLPSQAKFHRMRSAFKGFSGPVGSGKSAALAMEAIRLAFLNPGRVGLLGAPTYSMLRDTTLRALIEHLEENRVAFDSNRSDGVLTVKDPGSRILMRSLEEYEHLRGTNLAWFGVDELTYVAEEAWLRLEARLRDPKASRRHGFAVWTPKGHDWVYRRFVQEPVPGYRAVLAVPFENHHLLEAVPDYYERLRHSYDERFYSQEALGQYRDLDTERVYHAFSRTGNVKPLAVDPKRPLMWALDFNVDPMCSLVVQRIGDLLHVVDEIVISRSTTQEACQEFRNRWGQHDAGLIVYGDASGNQRQTTGLTDYQMIKRFWSEAGNSNVSYRVPPANPAIRDRVHLVNGLLCNAAGQQRLLVHPRCKELVKDLEEVRYKPNTSIVDKDRDSKRTHLSDALGYMAWQEFVPKPSYGERNRPLF